MTASGRRTPDDRNSVADARIRRALEAWSSELAPALPSPELVRARGTGRIRRRRAATAAAAVAAVAALVTALVPLSHPSPARQQQSRAASGHAPLLGELAAHMRRLTTPRVLADARQAARSDLSLLTATTASLYRSAGTTRNVVLVPSSLGEVLVQLELGARGQTGSQIATALGMGGTSASAQAQLWNALSQQLTIDQRVSHVQLEQANYLFLERTLHVHGTYLDALARYFGEGIWEADFAGRPAATTRTINSWVRSVSHLRVPPLLPPGSITRRTAFVLANAFHFDASWSRALAFDPGRTHSAVFHLASGATVSVPTMHWSGVLRTAALDGMRAVELPYAGGRFSALAIEPETGSLTTMLDSWTPTSLSHLEAGLRQATVDLALPRLSLGSASSCNGALRAAGVRQAFSTGADFGGITSTPTALDMVGQSVAIRVDEHGTNAGGGTGSVSTLVSGGRDAVAVAFNHPFVFLIRDDATGAVIVEAVVADPAAVAS